MVVPVTLDTLIFRSLARKSKNLCLSYRKFVDLRVERVIIGLVSIAHALHVCVILLEFTVFVFLQRQVILVRCQLPLKFSRLSTVHILQSERLPVHTCTPPHASNTAST